MGDTIVHAVISRSAMVETPQDMSSPVNTAQRQLRVLIVDDSEERRELVRQSLIDVQCEVLGFASRGPGPGRGNPQPDVVIIDMEYPGGTPWKICGEYSHPHPAQSSCSPRMMTGRLSPGPPVPVSVPT